MKNFWVCFWLFLIFTCGSLSDRDSKRLAEITDTLKRIEAKLDVPK